MTVLLNRQLAAAGRPWVNPKRIHRIMWLNHLPLPGYTRRRARTMEHGRCTLRRNLRWCSDAFTIRCWNGEQVPVLFSLDCGNRVAMRWLATTGESPARWCAI